MNPPPPPPPPQTQPTPAPCVGCGAGTIQDVLREMGVPLVPQDASTPERPPTARQRRAGGRGRTRLWRSLGRAADERIEAACVDWLKTPYRAGQRVRGGGVDCAQLIAGVLDRAYRRPEKTPIAKLPTDVSIHQPNAAMQTVLGLVRGYGAQRMRLEELTHFEPGDVAVVRSELQAGGRDAHGHALVAGSKPWRWLHAMPNTGVCWTSLAALPPLVALYRPANKQEWGAA